MKYFLLSTLGCTLAAAVFAQDNPSAYKIRPLPVDERVADLLERMSPEEKVRQLDMYYGCESLIDKKTQTIDNPMDI